MPGPVWASCKEEKYLVCFLLGNSRASEFDMTFRNILSVPSSQVGLAPARDLPRRKHKTFRTWRNFEIKNNILLVTGLETRPVQPVAQRSRYTNTLNRLCLTSVYTEQTEIQRLGSCQSVETGRTAEMCCCEFVPRDG